MEDLTQYIKNKEDFYLEWNGNVYFFNTKNKKCWKKTVGKSEIEEIGQHSSEMTDVMLGGKLVKGNDKDFSYPN